MRSEAEMLKGAGHQIEFLEADNRTIDGMFAKIAAAGSLFHSRSSNQRMAELLEAFQPDVVHLHNWFPQLSPSIISVAKSARVPVVQTLHNFRMLCANGVMFRDGHVCQDCLGKSMPLGAAVHACYGGSRVGSALVSTAFAYHRFAHAWDGISTFIVLSEYQRALLIRGGIDTAHITVKPNFVRDTGEVGTGRGGYALFVGRLMPEKGIRTVLKAWSTQGISQPLWIMGDGPLADEVRQKSTALKNVAYFGYQPAPDVLAAMGDARFVIFASECVEAFGLTVVEAFSRGTPVLAAHSESIAELVLDGETGLCFTPGDAADLAAKAALLAGESTNYRSMRMQCRRIYEARYTETTNYKLLMDIYQRAVSRQNTQALAAIPS